MATREVCKCPKKANNNKEINMCKKEIVNKIAWKANRTVIVCVFEFLHEIAIKFEMVLGGFGAGGRQKRRQFDCGFKIQFILWLNKTIKLQIEQQPPYIFFFLLN